jgi:peroxin-5
MDSSFLSSLFADGCNVDGSTTSANPISAILNAVIDSSAAFGPLSTQGRALADDSVGFTLERSDFAVGRNSNFEPLGMLGASVPRLIGGIEPPNMGAMMMHGQHQQMMMQGQHQMMMHMMNTQRMIQHQLHQEMQHQIDYDDENYLETRENEFGDYDDQEFVGDEGENIEQMFDDFYSRLHKDQTQQGGGLTSEFGDLSNSDTKSAWDSIVNNLHRTSSGEESYEFMKENSTLNPENRELQRQYSDFYFELGMKNFNSGQINEAIKAFEAHVQQDVEHSEAWRMLGNCYAENDQDKVAIVCLKRAVESDPYNLDALLALGICFVNELDSSNALQTLKSWVHHNPSFQGLTVGVDEFSDGSLMDEVTQLMLEVQRLAPRDLDVKIILGVLYNVSQDYDLAAQLFNEVLQIRLDDYSLYNKVGATLANGNRSSSAIHLYSKALSIRPSYARGWLNLGISYANLSRYEDAAKAYIQALHLNPNARHIWGYVRVVLTCMDKLELVALTTKEDLVGLAAGLGVEL